MLVGCICLIIRYIRVDGYHINVRSIICRQKVKNQILQYCIIYHLELYVFQYQIIHMKL